MANLQVGSSGQEVLYYQNNLWGLGFSVTSDGIFGPETQQAVKNFQYTWGNLAIDGIIGPQTAAAIDEALNLLNQGRWNSSTDPMVYTPGAPIRIAAPTTISPALVSPSVAAEYPGGAQYQPSEVQASQQFVLPAGGLMGIEWKWIGLGIAGIALLFYLTKHQEEEEE